MTRGTQCSAVGCPVASRGLRRLELDSSCPVEQNVPVEE